MPNSIGLLWFRDDPKRSLATDIDWCHKKFMKKFKVKPDTIHVAESEIRLYEKVTEYVIIPTKNINPRDFWMTYRGEKLEAKDGDK